MNIVVRPVMREEFRDAASVAARGLFHLFAHVGSDPAEQLAAAYAAYRAIPFENQTTIGAFVGGEIVGMAKVSEPGHCWCDDLGGVEEPSDRNEAGVLAYRRFLATHHPGTPHWWIGPVGVEAGLQGRGIGTAVMTALLGRLSRSQGEEVWLEAEPHVVDFYRHLGFADVAAASDPDGIEVIFQRLVLRPVREPGRQAGAST